MGAEVSYFCRKRCSSLSRFLAQTGLCLRPLPPAN